MIKSITVGKLAIMMLLASVLTFHVSAQVIKVDSTSLWRHSFKAGLNINQANFSSNWKAGGSNSFGFNTLLNYKANYKNGPRSWDNEIDFLYGMVNNQGQGYRKTMDRFYIDTKYGYSLSSKVNLFIALNALSQFADGTKYVTDVNGVEQSVLISSAFSPLFLTGTIGLEYKPVPYFHLRASPIAPRATYLSQNDGRYAAVDPLTPYGVNVGESWRFEWYAAQLYAEFDKNLVENVNLKCRYVMFANYQTLDANLVDHRVDLNLTAKITRFITVSITGIYLYDHDQDNSPQYSQAFSLGVLYAFQNFEDKK